MPEPAEPKGEMGKRDNKEKRENKKQRGPKRYNVRDGDDDKEAKGGNKQRQENDKKNKDAGKNDD